MKTCFKCNQEKPLTEFYKHKKMGDGYLGKCKECTKKDAAQHRKENLEEIRAYDRKRAKLPHRAELRKKISQKFYLNFPLAYKAHTTLTNAVRDGKILKSKKCSICNIEKNRIHGHHRDYAKPLDVVWLCAACHRQLHRDLNQEAT